MIRYRASSDTTAALLALLACACAAAPAPLLAAEWGATVMSGGAPATAKARPIREGTSAIVTGSTKPARATGEKAAGTVVVPADRTVAAPSTPIENVVRQADRLPAEVRAANLSDDKRLVGACTLLMDEATKTALDVERRGILEATQEMVRQSDLLEQRIQVLKEWMERRDLLVRKVSKLVVDTFAKMKPEAAAVQLAAMDLGQAGAIVSRLEPDKLSAIVSEMDPGKAAAILVALNGAVMPDGDQAKDK